MSTEDINYEKKLLRYKDGYAVSEIKKYCIIKILAIVQKSVQYIKTELIKNISLRYKDEYAVLKIMKSVHSRQ